MIIICFKKKIKPFSQKGYNNLIYSINIDDLMCPSCKSKKCFDHHGSYKRSIIDDASIIINVLRLKCKKCKVTHALLISGMVPYRRHVFVLLVHPEVSKSSFSDIYNLYKSACLERIRSFEFFFYHPT